MARHANTIKSIVQLQSPTKEQLEQAQIVGKQLLGNIVSYSMLFQTIASFIDNEEIEPANRLKACQLLMNEYQFIRTQEVKLKEEKEDLSVISDERLDTLIKEMENKEREIILPPNEQP